MKILKGKTYVFDSGVGLWRGTVLSFSKNGVLVKWLDGPLGGRESRIQGNQAVRLVAMKES